MKSKKEKLMVIAKDLLGLTGFVPVLLILSAQRFVKFGLKGMFNRVR